MLLNFLIIVSTCHSSSYLSLAQSLNPFHKFCPNAPTNTKGSGIVLFNVCWAFVVRPNSTCWKLAGWKWRMWLALWIVYLLCGPYSIVQSFCIISKRITKPFTEFLVISVLVCSSSSPALSLASLYHQVSEKGYTRLAVTPTQLDPLWLSAVKVICFPLALAILPH